MFARYPQVAAEFAPDHPRVVAERVNHELQSQGGLVSGDTKGAARTALRSAPMLMEPLLLGAIDRLLVNDDRRARQLLTHALARNPRSEIARLLMLEIDLRTNDVRRAVFDMTILGRLLPDVRKVFVPELARLARDPRTNRTLAPVLRADPDIMAQVLVHLAGEGASPRLILELAGNIPTAPPPPNVTDWREPLLQAMVARGEFENAHRLWAAFAGMNANGSRRSVYDGGFRRLPGLPPFNWKLSASEVGAAEPAKAGGLEVQYYGREAGDLATQLMTLAPGRYRLVFRAEGEMGDAAQPRLFWRIACAAKGPLILDLPIVKISFAGRTIASEFNVPAACSGQWLKLVGVPTEFPKVENLTIREIGIQPVAGQS